MHGARHQTNGHQVWIKLRRIWASGALARSRGRQAREPRGVQSHSHPAHCPTQVRLPPSLPRQQTPVISEQWQHFRTWTSRLSSEGGSTCWSSGAKTLFLSVTNTPGTWGFERWWFGSVLETRNGRLETDSSSAALFHHLHVRTRATLFFTSYLWAHLTNPTNQKAGRPRPRQIVEPKRQIQQIQISVNVLMLKL